MKPFAEQLRKRRESLGLSQSDLARLIETDPSHVAHYEAGRREPTLTNVRSLAKALQVSIDYLAGTDGADYDRGF